MIIILTGASGSGKSTIENELACHHGFKKIISYTTRSPRPGEINGKDYYFISDGQFDEMIGLGLFAEYDEYSQGRKYGTLKSDYVDSNRVVVLTPNGIRQIKQKVDNSDIFIVYIQSSLGSRIVRYVKRIGTSNFTFDDKNEISARVERDYAMFLGIEREVNMVVQNEDGMNIKKIVSDILNG